MHTEHNNEEHLTCSTDRYIDVVVVKSLDNDDLNNKNKILVKPESNPYYEHENNEGRQNFQTIGLECSIDKIKAINNIYYE